MQRDDNRVVPSVEIVNAPPAKDDDEAEAFDKVDVLTGATELDKKNLQHLLTTANYLLSSPPPKIRTIIRCGMYCNSKNANRIKSCID